MFCLAYLVFCLAYLVFCLANLVICLAYLVFCLAYLMFCFAYLVFWLAYLVFGGLFGVHYIFFAVIGVFILWINFPKSSPFCVHCGKRYAGLKKVHHRRWWRWWLLSGVVRVYSCSENTVVLGHVNRLHTFARAFMPIFTHFQLHCLFVWLIRALHEFL